MRNFIFENMIGTILFYGFYPLARYLARRRPEPSKNSLSAMVNKTTVWDGATVTTCESQATLLEQQLGPSCGCSRETEERVSLEWREAIEPVEDKEHCMTVCVSETTSEGQSAQTEPDLKILSLKELPSSSKVNKQAISCGEPNTIQTPDVEADLQTPAESTAEVTECWDEYIAFSCDTSKDSRENRSSLYLVPPVCTSELSQSEQQLTQPGYHFAVGPGLVNEVQCPLWQFPALSYYPTMAQTIPFEVIWRVWECIEDTSAPALIPFSITKTVMDFTVMSYNILSQDLLEANHDLYTHCPLEVLEWIYRCRLLLEEIARWLPDILCLQEVQENHFYDQLLPELTRMGYTCVYKRRTGTKTDGCATCYRSCFFAEGAVIEVEFFRPEIELLDRHNVAIIVVLRPIMGQESEVKTMGPPLCVANTHLLFNPRRGDVKLAQLAILLAEVDTVVKTYKAKGEHCNIILCGDFNSVPHTPLYQLITKSKLYFQGLQAWMISGQEDLSSKSHCNNLHAPLWPDTLGITDNCQYTSVNQVFERHRQKAGTRQYSHESLLQWRFCPAAGKRPQDLEMIPGVTDNKPDSSQDHPFTSRCRHILSHRFDLQSVYRHVLPNSGNAEVTTLHSQVGATVDYIFYSPKHTRNIKQQAKDTVEGNGLKLIGFLSLLSEDVLWSMNGLPSHIFPSDHLSLLAKFQVDMNAP